MQIEDREDPAILENAVFRNADLRGADFTDARLDQIDLTDARIDAETTFDDTTIYDQREDVTSGVRSSETDAAPPGAWVQRRLERLHEENALSTVARKYHIRKQRAKQRHYRRVAGVGKWREWLTDDPLGDWLDRREWRDLARPQQVRAWDGWAWLRSPREWRDWGAYWTWLQLRVFQLGMGYGESVARVASVAAAVVALWMLLYPLGDWVVPNPGTPEAIQRGAGPESDTPVSAVPLGYPSLPTTLGGVPGFLGDLGGTLLDSLYFSTVTFTTLGFGDFSPVGHGRTLATVEAALDVTLFAVPVFVLGRRATR